MSWGRCNIDGGVQVLPGPSHLIRLPTLWLHGAPHTVVSGTLHVATQSSFEINIYKTHRGPLQKSMLVILYSVAFQSSLQNTTYNRIGLSFSPRLAPLPYFFLKSNSALLSHNIRQSLIKHNVLDAQVSEHDPLSNTVTQGESRTNHKEPIGILK